MRKFAIVLIGALLVGTVFVVALAAQAVGKTSVTGQLIDLACYTQNKENTGIQHRGKGLNCARACALEGFPVGLLTTDGKIYRVTGDLAANSNAKLAPHMSHTVTLTGDVSEKDGQMTIASGDLKMERP